MRRLSVLGCAAVGLFLTLVAAAGAASPRADLVVGSLSRPPDSVAPGGSFTLASRVVNRGRVKAKKSTVRFLLSTDKRRGSGDVAVASQSVKALKRREGARRAVKLTVPAFTPGGSYFVIACADGRRKVKEAKESNNCRASRTTLRVTAASTAGPGGTTGPDGTTGGSGPDGTTGGSGPSGGAGPGDPHAAPNPLTCEGYPEPRVFVEDQAWWSQTPGEAGSDFGHAHMGACIPERETLTRDTTFNVRVILHDNPGKVKYGALVVKGADYETTVYKTGTELAGFTCPRGTCEKWVTFPLDLSSFERSGLQEVRFRLFIREPDGLEMHTSLNWQVNVQNGAPRQDVTRRPWLRGKGWYTGAGYCEAVLTSVPVPDAPLTWTWSPALRMMWDGDSTDLPVSGHSVTLDPDFHRSPPEQGTVLEDGPGPWEGNVVIDPLRLSPGRHRLVSRADCADPRGSTNSGVLVVMFNVADGTAN